MPVHLPFKGVYMYNQPYSSFFNLLQLMKKFYLIASALLCGSAMIAQNHNVDIEFTEEFIAADGSPVHLEALYVPSYSPAKSADEPGTAIIDGKDKTTPASVIANLENADFDGMPLEVTLGQDGLAYVNFPTEAYINGTLTPVSEGDIRLRIAFGGSPSRPGDTHDLYVHDMTGIYATVSAPAGTKINGYVVAASCAIFKTTEHPTGDPENGKYFHTVMYDFEDLTANNTPTNIQTTGEAYGALNLFTFRRPTKGLDGCDAEGFPCKYFDVVFRGIKSGQKVGLCNYQTLYKGITPHPYDASASISTIGSDDANAPVEYFNLQGMRVENPTSGLYIKRQGQTTEKVLVK